MTCRRPVSAWTLCGAVALVTMLLVPAGHAQLSSAASAVQRLWYQAYDQGVRAALAGNWTLAIPALEAAKRGGPAPGRRVLFQGDRVDVFNPDYYLGLAYNATSRFAEAEAAFARVADAGLVRQGDREFEELRKQRARATYERTLLDGERAIAAGRYAEAEKALQEVVQSLADDGRAGKLAARAREALNTGNVAQQAPPVYQAPVPPPEVRPTDPTPVPTPAPDTKTATVEPRPAEPAKPGPKDPGPPPAKAAASNNPRVDPRPMPPVFVDDATAERQGMAAYFAGDYDEAIRVLKPAFDASPPSQRVTFYLACSYAARALLTGARDQGTVDEVRQMFAYASGDSPQFTADRAFISPAVLRMLGSTAPAATPRRATAS